MAAKTINHRRFKLALAVTLCSLAGCVVAAIHADESGDNVTGTVYPESRFSDDELEEALTRAEQSYNEKMAEFPPKEDLINDWEKPEVALFISGRLHGYMEPCGCTGLETQKGGLLRRFECQQLLQNRGWDLVCIDAGNQVRRFGQQPVIKIQKSYKTICDTMAYDVVGFGVDDLKLPGIDLLQSMANVDNFDSFISANINVAQADITSNFRIIERNGKRIFVTCLLGDEHVVELQNQNEHGLSDMQTALTALVPQIQNANCDLNVLVAHAGLETCRELAQKFPVFDLLVTAGGAGDPTLMPEIIAGNDAAGQPHETQMIQVGVKGMYVGVIGLYNENGETTIKYERVPLDYRFEPPVRSVSEVKDTFREYQDELRTLYQGGLNQDINPRQHPSGYSYVGSESCIDCHEDEFDIWAEGAELDGIGAHVPATDSLVDPGERTWVARNFDPECLSCHVTGWNPQGFYPYESGYLDFDQHEHLHANGCENCHGPGSAHVNAENNPGVLTQEFDRWDSNRNGTITADEFQLMCQNMVIQGQPNELFQTADTDDSGFLDRNEFKEYRLGVLRQEMVLTYEQAKDEHCKQCHDLDNSPDFLKDGGFEEYWEQIKHGENW
ncbi:MAG: multiheme c-type cytochrome [Planctomycetota bacterium]